MKERLFSVLGGVVKGVCSLETLKPGNMRISVKGQRQAVLAAGFRDGRLTV
jgi:hypothetical protein